MIDYDMIPQSTMDSLKRYVDQGIPTGGFLEAVLSNDLMEAVGRADERNQAALIHICAWVYNEMPHQSHGSPEKVHEWLETKQAERVSAEPR